jgi:hypothetical protein
VQCTVPWMMVFFSLDYRAVHSDNNIHDNFLWFCVCVGIVTICDELCVGIVTICDELFYFIFKWVVHLTICDGFF